MPLFYHKLNICERSILFIEEIIKIFPDNDIEWKVFKDGNISFEHQMLRQMIYTPITLAFGILVY